MNVGLALALFFTLGWMLMYTFRAESRSAALPFYSGRERLWVQFTPVFMFAHMSAACITITRAPVISAPSGVLGVATFVAAIAFWFWGRMMIGPLRVRRLPEEPPLRLRSDGAFGIVRHPLYFGYLLAASAPLLVVPRPFLLGTLGVCFVALAVRALQEERRLHAQLGTEYEAYCRSVRRLIPFVW